MQLPLKCSSSSSSWCSTAHGHGELEQREVSAQGDPEPRCSRELCGAERAEKELL